jgi:hypothetical protein
MRFLIRPALALAVVLTFAAVGTGTLVSAPAAHAAGGCSFGYGASGNGTTVSVTGNVNCSSSSTGGGGSTGGGVTAPPCWLAPLLTGKAMYQLMQTGNTGGMSSQQFFLDIPHPGQAAQYKNDPVTQGVWWVPVSNGTAAGNACAYALYWPAWGPPPTPGATIPGYPVMNEQEASAIAFNHLKLPNLHIRLNPPVGGKSYVNLPTWVYSDPQYPDPVSATATISIPVIGAGITFSVSATVTATEVGGLQISLPSGGGTVDESGCGNWGSDSQSGGLTCGVTFNQPSGNAPFPVTVSTTWNITGPGVDTTETDTRTVNATVYEIQSVNGG